MDPAVIDSLTGQPWFRFLLTGLFAFLTGLEMQEYLRQREQHLRQGTVRTYTFTALLGFVLYQLDPSFRLYLAGLLGLFLLYALFYWYKLRAGQPGILQLLIGAIVYTFGPVSQLLPPWFLVLLFVAVVFTLSARPLTRRLIERLDRQELLTLAKFLLLSAVILPLLPDRTLSPLVPASPYRIWVAVVVISSLSYVGYLLRRYVWPDRGDLVTGLVGGLYSSTAITVVLARRSCLQDTPNPTLHAAIIAATAVMYLRLLLLVALLNPAFLPALALPLIALFAAGLALALYLLRRGGPRLAAGGAVVEDDNPLELRTAFLFALLFAGMLLLTRFVSGHYGAEGLQALSFLVGFTDVDPFVLSLLRGEFPGLDLPHLAGALLIAAGSNDLLKGIYAVTFGRFRDNRAVLLWLSLLGAITIAWGLWVG